MNREIDILQELATLDPLDDRAFAILASDDEQFKLMAEAFSGKALDDGKLININGEFVLSANGRLIRLDSLRDATSEFFNLEGQIQTSKFPFKRHIFYSAFIYINGIQKGDEWDKLKPVTSIVIYKNKGDADLIETASLSGTLVKTNDDVNQLTLIAVNTAKWKDAKSEETKAYLATLHHGILTKDNEADFQGVDVNSQAFSDFQRAVKMACAKTKQQEYIEKGDKFMATKYVSYLSDEERVAAMSKGKLEGLNLAWEIINMLKLNIPISEIADKYRVSTTDVERFKTAL